MTTRCKLLSKKMRQASSKDKLEPTTPSKMGSSSGSSSRPSSAALSTSEKTKSTKISSSTSSTSVSGSGTEKTNSIKVVPSSSSGSTSSKTEKTVLPPPGTEKCVPFYPSTLFQEKTFGENYSETEFIENLTYKLLNEVNKLLPNESSATTGGSLSGMTSVNQELEDKQAEYLGVFEQLFQRSIFDLERLMKDVNVTVGKLVKDTEKASQKHQSKLQSFHEELESISEKFKNIEDVINQVGNTTVQIGNTLDTVDKQKSRAIEARQLMRFFNEFNSYDTILFEKDILPNKKFKHAIFKKKGSQHRAAKVIQELSLIATDLTKVENCKKAIANIKLYNDDLLRSLLDDFSQSIRMIEDNRKTAINEMKKKARILFDIKSEDKCIELFVKMRFEKFINVSGEFDRIDKEIAAEMVKGTQEQEKKLESLLKLTTPPKVEKSDDNEDEEETEQQNETEEEQHTDTDSSQNTNKSEQDIANSINNLQESIKNTQMILQERKMILKEVAFKESRRIAIEGVVDVKEYANFLSKIEKATSSEYSIISEVFSTSSRDVILSFLQKIVDSILKEIVNNLLKGKSSNATDKELQDYLYNFEDVYNCTTDFIQRLTTEHEDIPTLKTNLVRSIENIFSEKKKGYGDMEKRFVLSSYNAIIDDIVQTEKVILSQLYDFQAKKGLHSGVFSNSLSLNLTQIVYYAMQDSDQLSLFQAYPRLQLDIIVSLLHINTEALSRCKKLSIKNEIPNNMLTIFELLKDAVYGYVKKGLEFAVATLEAPGTRKEQKTEPKTELYTAIHLTNSVLQKIQRHLEQNILPSVVSISLPIQLQCIKLKDDLFSTLEQHVVKGLELMLRAIVEHCTFILEKDESKRTAEAYKPKENDTKFVFVEHQPTQACMRCCSFLSSHCEQIQSCLFGKNREFFLTKMGMHFFQTLSSSLKQFSVSNLGAIKLMRDLSEYQKCMRQFQVTIVEDQFDTLREISNVLLVLPQNLSEVVQQVEKNPSVKHEDVLSFIRMRSDYKQSKPIFKDKIPGF